VVARTLVAVAVLLAVALPTVAPLSNLQSSSSSEPRQTSPPLPPSLAPRHARSTEPAADAEPVAEPEGKDGAGLVLPHVCLKALRITVPGWTREAVDWRTVRLAGAAVEDGAASAEANDEPAAAEDAGAAADAGLAALRPVLDALPAGSGEAEQAAALAAAAQEAGLRAAVLLDEAYYVYTPADLVFVVPLGGVLPEGLVGEPVAGCFDPDDLVGANVGLLGALSAFVDHLVMPNGGWAIDGVRADVGYARPG
jgi:hypothetical protein